MSDSNGGNQVHIQVQDLVKMMSKEIASEVVDNLKKTEIDPLKKRIDLLENKQTESSVSRKTALDVLWKVAVVMAGIISIITKINPNFFTNLFH